MQHLKRILSHAYIRATGSTFSIAFPIILFVFDFSFPFSLWFFDSISQRRNSLISLQYHGIWIGFFVIVFVFLD